MVGGTDTSIGEQVLERREGVRSYLEIICNKTVDNRVHAAIQTAESDSQVVDDDMMRHIRIEVHQHLQQNRQYSLSSSQNIFSS